MLVKYVRNARFVCCIFFLKLLILTTSTLGSCLYDSIYKKKTDQTDVLYSNNRHLNKRKQTFWNANFAFSIHLKVTIQ